VDDRKWRSANVGKSMRNDVAHNKHDGWHNKGSHHRTLAEKYMYS